MNPLAKSEVRSPIREVRLRVAAFFALIMLSCDTINPVKVVCSIIGLDTQYALVLFTIAFFAVIIANAKELTYFLVKVFFHSILSIFFSSMEVLGRENIPAHGPIIFTGNHMNQFVDGAVMMVTNPHNVGFLVAEKSYHKRIIGDFAKAVGSIPVSRPQDAAKAGPGKIMFDGINCKGEGTKFTALKKGDRIRPGKSAEAYRLKEVISDTEAILAEDYGEASPRDDIHGQGKWTTYDVLGHVDQAKMFESVQAALAAGNCLGIFPEGGSHDRTDLLPLKAGVAAIALGVQEKYGVNVPIVPVGLNYFRGHRFRGRVVVEFGAPIVITKELQELYGQSKRTAYNRLLTAVEDGMRSVIVTAGDYQELKLIHAARRLFQQSSTSATTKEKQDMARRFSLGYRLLKEKFAVAPSAANGTTADSAVTSGTAAKTPKAMPSDLLEIHRKLEEYTDALDYWGLKDYQLQIKDSKSTSSSQSKGNSWRGFGSALYLFLHGAFVLILASIPSLLLNAPVGAAAHYWAEAEAKKDLKASRVKLAARDVLLSKKILFSLCAVPVLWVSYAILLLTCTNLQVKTVIVLFLCCPLFSYLGVMAVEASMNDLKDLRPAFLRLFPKFREEGYPKLQQMRQSLRSEVRAVVHKYGPLLGPLYLDQSESWEKHYRKSSKAVEDVANANTAATTAATTVPANSTETTAKEETAGTAGESEGVEITSTQNEEYAAARLLNNITSLGPENEEEEEGDGESEQDSGRSTGHKKNE